jgi:sulfonate transport system substrate-binding protein
MARQASIRSRAFSFASATVSLFVVLAAVVGVWASTRPGEPKVVHIGSFSTAIDYAPYLIARNQGWLQKRLEKAGYKVDFTEFQTLPAINEALATGHADVVFEAEPPAIIARSNGIKVSIRGISCSLTQQLIVPENSSRRSIADLRGAKIAVLAGSSSNYGLVKDLQEVGISPQQVSIIDMTPPNAKAAFETGQIDAWAVWPPFVEQEIISKKGRILRGGDAKIDSIFVERDGFVASNRDAAAIISSVISSTKMWIVAHQPEAERIVATQLKLPLSVVALAWPKHNFSATLSDALVADIQDKADFLADRHMIRNSVNVGRDLVVR